jgi:hypothetical protein
VLAKLLVAAADELGKPEQIHTVKLGHFGSVATGPSGAAAPIA